MERSAVAASQAIFDARDQRATRVTALERDAAILIERLEAGEAAVDDDEPLHRIASNVEFFLSEETNQSELRFNLEKLQALHNRVKGEPVQLLEAPPPPPKSKGWFSW
jgi:hypothetical protein